MSSLLLIFLTFRAWTLRRTQFQREVLSVVAAEITFVLAFYPVSRTGVYVGLAGIILLITLTGAPFRPFESKISVPERPEREVEPHV